MFSKEFHDTRIKELEFQKNIKKNQDNRTHNTSIAFLSIIVIIFMFEINKAKKDIWWIIISGIIFLVLMGVINKEIHYPEDERIQRNYGALLGRKK